MSKAGFRIVRTAVLGVSALALLAGCVTEPMGPQVAVMPAPNKPFEVFQQDQGVCSQFAGQQVSGAANQANSNAFGTAVLGTILGAGLGAAIGGGPGAAIGAASGALGGTIVGSGPSSYAQYGVQQQYDMAYSQCMYAKGNQVPGYYSQGGGSFSPPPPPPQGG